MKVLSMFDGMSCGRVAVERCGLGVEYFAAEIDKHAIKVAKKNYPDTIQLGSVEDWQDWEMYFDWREIDLVIGGSPCQGFSFAGKQLNFEDPRSKLFFEFVAVLDKVRAENPKVLFLLENVKMKKEYSAVITELLGVEPILINSALVSAQNRNRLYWTNITNITQPADKNILLQDILESEVPEKYVITGGWLEWFKLNGDERIRKRFSALDPIKSICMTARQYANWNGTFVKVNKKGFPKLAQSKSSCLTGGANSGGNHSDMDLLLSDTEIRRLTPVECERLQTLPDNYTKGVSDTQRYKMLGNGWTVDVLTHIFKNITC